MFKDPSGLKGEFPCPGLPCEGYGGSADGVKAFNNDGSENITNKPKTTPSGGGTGENPVGAPTIQSTQEHVNRVNREFHEDLGRTRESVGNDMPGVGELFTGAGSGGNPVSIPNTINKQESKGNGIAANPSNWRQTHLRHADQDGVEIPQQSRPWMTTAQGEKGVTETKGPIHTARIIEYHNTTVYPPRTDDEDGPWCSSFLNWVMEKSGLDGSNSAWSLSWLRWGQSVSTPVYGAVGVINAVDSKGNSVTHVGIVVGTTADGRIVMLGGNQGNNGMVRLSAYPQSWFVGFRLPNGYVPPIEHFILPIINVNDNSTRTR